MSARTPRLEINEVYHLALRGHMIMRISPATRNSKGYSFRARLIRNTLPLSSFEFTMNVTPEEYAREGLPQ